MIMNTMTNYLLPSVKKNLCSYQVDRISLIIHDFLEINQQMKEFHFEKCPKCGQLHPVLVKAGKTKAGKQMLKCKSCKKRFVCDCGQLTFYSHQPQSKWNDLIIETQNGNSLLRTATKINVNESTAFRMRHKYLRFIEVLLEPYELKEEVEMDETYVTHSRKGRIVEGHPGKKRGTPSSKRGLSEEQICIMTAVQRIGKCIARSFNVAKPSSIDAKSFCKCIKDKSYVFTDGLASYTKVLQEKECINKVLHSYKEYDQVNHLNIVNCFHSQIEEQYRYYRGVSSKYINRYNALFTLQREYMDADNQELVLLIMKRLRIQKTYFFIRQMREEKLFKFTIA